MHRAMKNAAILLGAGLMAFSAAARPRAADEIPPGTILPLILNSTLSSMKARPGQIASARVMQDVPLPDGQKIRAGATVIGHITKVTPGSNGNPARLSLRFDTLKAWHRRIAIATNIRAIASFVEVEQAQIPLTGPDRGTPESAWTTAQIGGDAVYRGGGPVASEFGDVGTPVYDGVLDQLKANPDGGCRAAIDSKGAPQALWVFSSDACGAYNLPHLKIAHAGRANPAGEIILESTKGQLKVHAGSGLLLRVDSSGASGV